MNIQIKTRCKNCGRELAVSEVNDSYPLPSDLKPGLIIILKIETCPCVFDEAHKDGYREGYEDGNSDYHYDNDYDL